VWGETDDSYTVVVKRHGLEPFEKNSILRPTIVQFENMGEKLEKKRARWLMTQSCIYIYTRAIGLINELICVGIRGATFMVF